MTTKTKAPPLTAEQATSFDRHSETSFEILSQAAELRGCECVAYQDWFTYRRWQALGLQVQKGQKGSQLTVYNTTEETDPKTGLVTTKTRPWKAYVFCRCQVQEKESRP